MFHVSREVFRLELFEFVSFGNDYVAVLFASTSEVYGNAEDIPTPESYWVMLTILELAQKIKKLTGSSSQPTFHSPLKEDLQRRCPDISLARRLLGWEPKIGLKEGLRRTITWFQQRKHTFVGGSKAKLLNWWWGRGDLNPGPC